MSKDITLTGLWSTVDRAIKELKECNDKLSYEEIKRGMLGLAEGVDELSEYPTWHIFVAITELEMAKELIENFE